MNEQSNNISQWTDLIISAPAPAKSTVPAPKPAATSSGAPVRTSVKTPARKSSRVSHPTAATIYKVHVQVAMFIVDLICILICITEAASFSTNHWLKPLYDTILQNQCQYWGGGGQNHIPTPPIILWPLPGSYAPVGWSVAEFGDTLTLA